MTHVLIWTGSVIYATVMQCLELSLFKISNSVRSRYKYHWQLLVRCLMQFRKTWRNYRKVAKVLHISRTRLLKMLRRKHMNHKKSSEKINLVVRFLPEYDSTDDKKVHLIINMMRLSMTKFIQVRTAGKVAPW